MSNPGRLTYRPNLNRNPTRKWAEAQQVDYEGDDWGDDGYDDYEPEPVSAGPQRHLGWGQRGGQAAQRSFTNPVQPLDYGRSSFERDDERRNFSTGASDPRYQTQAPPGQSQRSGPTEPLMATQNNQHNLHLNTQVPGPSSASTAQSTSRANPHADAYGVPYSAPVSRGTQPLDSKPLPFVRPADIYKRMEEERERERLSQESSRPSIDSATGAVGESPDRMGENVLTKPSGRSAEEADTRRMRSTLDTVAERDSEYGIGPTSMRSGRSTGISSTGGPADTPAGQSTRAIRSENSRGPQIGSPTASSVYTDRPDPVSASSTRSPYRTSFGTQKSPVLESFRQGILQYSPSTRKPSGLQRDIGGAQSGDDLPNFDHAVSPSHSMTSETIKAVQADSSRERISPTKPEPENLETQRFPSHRTVEQQVPHTENTSILSPVSTDDAPRRSDNDSTSDISPINDKKPDLGRIPSQATSDRFESMPGEPVISHDRGRSVTAIDPPEKRTEDVAVPAVAVLPGSRPANDHPTVGESQGRRPLSVEIPQIPESRRGIVSDITEPSTTLHSFENKALPSTQLGLAGGRRSPPKKPTSQNELAPPSTSRSTSEDYHEWQNQRRHFNAKHGIDDSNAASPAVSSPISRAESPAKGTVREIAGKLENSSGRASPVDTTPKETRPPVVDQPLHTRNESFRPALPGGWLSYTTNADSTENIDNMMKPQPTPQRPIVQEQFRTESTDSIPTAVAPRNWKTSSQGPSEAAFAAAAAAGNAMAGAFSGRALTRHNPQYSETDSDDDDDASSQSHQPKISETRDFASSIPESRVQNPAPVLPEFRTRDVASIQSEPQTRSAENQPRLPQSSKTFTIESESSPQNITGKTVDFPAPLRTNRAVDNKQPSPRLSIPIAPSISDEQDPEQLQYDIVQSLTPKTSSMDNVTTRELETLPKFTETKQTLPRQSSMASDTYDVLPQEYNSYWSGPQTPPRGQEHQPERVTADDSTPTATRPPIPTTTNMTANDSTSTTTRSPILTTTNITANDSTPTATRPPIPTTTNMIANDSFRRPPFLEQRYSWETGTDDRDKDAVLSPSDFAKGVEVKKPVTPPLAAEPPSVITPPTPTAQNLEEETSEVSRDEEAPILPSPRPAVSSSFPKAKTEFRNILSIGDSSQRIRAFDENRQAYAEPNGLLEQWLSSMNTQEHADVFNLGRLPRASTSTAQNEIRPSPRRDMTSASGTKQMQEDGRRLLAAAGKYSGKAGTAAKGFFSKQKEKLRTVSSGDKVPTLRRRSGNIEVDTSPVPRQQEPTRSQRAPQLPTPSLETPPGEKSWSMLSSKIDQMFSDRSPQSNVSTTGSVLPTGSRASTAGTAPPPPASVVAALPSSNTGSTRPAAFPDYNAATDEPRDVATVRNHGQPRQSLASGSEPHSKTAAEPDRFSAPPRTDSLLHPRQRRPSTISDVSEISATPEERSEVVPRNVSPALENQSRNKGAPLVSPQLSRKEEEARDEPRDPSEGALPAYSVAHNGVDAQRQPKIAPGTQIVPVTDLNTTEAAATRQSTSRPFSFAGSETLNHATAQQAAVRPPTQSVQRSSESSDVLTDIEKSPQPNITEHPAYRNPENGPPAAENPLPSSRRPPQDFEAGRQRQQTTAPQQSMGEEGYRIPGPYVQEFRSPRSSKPTLNQDSVQQPYGPSQQSIRAPGSQERVSEQADRPGMIESHSQIESRRENEREKGRLLGGMFQPRSRSQSRRRVNEKNPGLMHEADRSTAETKSFKGLFGLGNRSSSPSNQYYDPRREQASTPEPRRDRKLSFDMLRPSASSAKTQTDTKKKRSSGFGALFGISGPKEKDSQRLERKASIPITHDSRQQYGPQSQSTQSPMQYPNSGPNYQYGIGNNQPNLYPQNQQFPHYSQQPQYPSSPSPVANKQFGPTVAPSQEPGSKYGLAEQAYDQDRLPNINKQATTERPQIYSNPSSNSITAISRASEPPPSASAGQQPIPTTRANRDISYGQNSYIPQASPVQTKPEIADHVKNLHKRSRSPRLGRPPSDEQIRGGHSETSSGSTTQHQPSKPVDQLGVFNNRKLSPAGGIPRSEEEQEKPWTIGLPDNGDDETSDSAARKRGRVLRFEDDGATKPGGQTNLVSPSSPHQYGQRNTTADMVSPITAIEPRGQGFHVVGPAAAGTGPSRTSYQQPRHEATIPPVGQRQPELSIPSESLPVPPSISSAGIIPHPQQQPTENLVSPVADPRTASTQKPVTFHSQTTRDSKQIPAEHGPIGPQTTVSTGSRPLTVAEKVMGIQPAPRGTVPEHRSTTPVPASSVSPVGMHAKSTTWPEERPSTAAVTTTNNAGTTVTTTTMRTGSKLGKGNVRTSTYIVGSNPPSRTGSNAASVDKRSSGGNLLGNTQTVASPLTTSAPNTIGNRGLQPSIGPMHSANVPSNVPQGKSFEAIELPGSRPDGYESEEEVVMSATAYPGQEWMPDYAIGASWDD